MTGKTPFRLRRLSPFAGGITGAVQIVPPAKGETKKGGYKRGNRQEAGRGLEKEAAIANKADYQMQRIFNRSKELEKRRILRANMTGEEKILWEKLRNKKLGLKFKRQYSIGPYVVDFYCSGLKLAIEIDGEVHSTGNVKEYDKRREEFIKSFGIKIFRFSNEEVKGNLSNVLKVIKEAK